MIYFETPHGSLLQYNPQTNIYKKRNSTSPKGNVISKQLFDTLQVKRIKKLDFSIKMNKFFKEVKDEWKYDYSHFRKLDNFNKDWSNYKIGTEVPYHDIPQINRSNVIMVYYWGKIYYHTINYNGTEKGQLICPKTFRFVKWCSLKNCAPVMNTNTKKII
jgi:hypothetical protein